MESDYLVDKAKKRLEVIRAGEDPDFDQANINPRWNVSTLVEEDGITPLSSSSKKDFVSHSNQSRPIKHLPADRKSLVTLQTEANLRVRHEKEAKAAESAVETSLNASWNAWRLSEHVNGSPTRPPLPMEARDKEKIARSIEEEYGAEALQTFLWQQDHPEEAAAAGLKPLHTKSPRSYQVKPTVHHPHRTERHVEKEALPYSSPVPPAWYRVEARAAQISLSRAVAPFPKFHHPGQYEWQPIEPSAHSSYDVRRTTSEHKDLSVGDELVASGGSYRWSCCRHPLRDSRGCTANDTDPTKRRIVVARSDDPTSVAALGLAPSKKYTSGSYGLDASHVRSRSDAAASSTSTFRTHAPPTVGGTGAVVGHSSSMGLSGPGVAIVARLAHTGIYTPCPATKEMMWSCCGAGESNAIGCTTKTVTKEHRWNLEGIDS